MTGPTTSARPIRVRGISKNKTDIVRVEFGPVQITGGTTAPWLGLTQIPLHASPLAIRERKLAQPVVKAEVDPKPPKKELPVETQEWLATGELIDYFCGAQAQIFIGDTLIDECQSIQFEAVTNRAPLYGYASHRFDTVLEGNILISGAFSINFVHQNYLIAALDRARKQTYNKAMLKKEKTDATLAGHETWLHAFKAMPAHQKKVALRQAQNLSKNDYGGFHERVVQAHLKKEKLESNDGLVKHKGIVSSELQKLGVAARFYEMPPFDMYVSLGSDPTGEMAFNLDRGPEPRSSRLPRGAVRKLSNVILTSSGQMISSSGEPILETYRFLARDLI